MRNAQKVSKNKFSWLWCRHLKKVISRVGQFFSNSISVVPLAVNQFPKQRHESSSFLWLWFRVSNQDFSRLWNNIEPDSIDYGLLEKTKNIHVVKAEFEWSDLGSWNSLFEISPKTKENNVIRGQGVVLDGKNNIVESQKKFTAIIGQNNLVVINTDDATLVVSRDQVEEVKRLIQYLEQTKRNDLL